MTEETKVEEELNLKEIEPEKRAAMWEQYVRNEVNSLLDIYLPEAISGNVGVKYVKPVLRIDSKTGNKIIDEKKAKGVMINIVFEFAGTIEFYDEKPE